jgi:hypothetical protein
MVVLLPVFAGYTVDVRLQEFRLASAKGQRLLAPHARGGALTVVWTDWILRPLRPQSAGARVLRQAAMLVGPARLAESFMRAHQEAWDGPISFR